jgi:hypothetical protein
MRRRPALTFFTLAVAAPLALPAAAQQKPVTEGQAQGVVRVGLADPSALIGN